MDMGPSKDSLPAATHTPEEKWFPIFMELWTSSSFSARDGALWAGHPHPIHAAVWILLILCW